MRTTYRIAGATALATALAIGVSACGSDDDSSSADSSPSAAAGAVNLADVCPATVVIQTDWNPEADHANVYSLLGPNPSVDADKKSVTGDLVAGGESTGIKVEIRAGGPAIGFQTASSQMYSDKSITMGYVSTDEAIQFSGKLPTVGVFAENDKSPMMAMWDPATYPDVTDIPSLSTALKGKGAVWRYFSGAAYMEYLTGSGQVDKSVLDSSYDGSPAAFVTDKGKAAQQGFATAEPYIYENEVAAWGKPVKTSLIADTGWAPYPETMSVRADDLESMTPCLKKLVPVMQADYADYFKDPSATNKFIVDLVSQYNNGWVYSEGVADFAVEQMKALKVATDGDNGYYGDQDSARIADLITKATPIYTAMKDNSVKDGLKPEDLFTNDFLDTKISLGF
jgi:hypothetical protein